VLRLTGWSDLHGAHAARAIVEGGASDGAWLLLLSATRPCAGRTCLSVGAENPWLRAGPVHLRGAHAEVRASTPAPAWSDRPWQTTGLGLSTDLDPPSRRGAEALFPCDLGGVWVLAEDRFTSGGALLRLPNASSGSRMVLEGGAAVTRLLPQPPEASWWLPFPAIRVPRVTHLFTRTAVRGSAPVAVAASLIASLSPYLPAGIRGNAVARLVLPTDRRRVLTAVIQGGGVGPWFVAPDGDIRHPLASGSGVLRLSPVRWLEAESRIGAEIVWRSGVRTGGLEHVHQILLSGTTGGAYALEARLRTHLRRQLRMEQRVEPLPGTMHVEGGITIRRDGGDDRRQKLQLSAALQRHDATTNERSAELSLICYGRSATVAVGATVERAVSAASDDPGATVAQAVPAEVGGTVAVTFGTGERWEMKATVSLEECPLRGPVELGRMVETEILFGLRVPGSGERPQSR
jgi:hypothetical protein